MKISVERIGNLRNFEGRAKTYRSVIVNGLNKMVYYVEDDTVYIAAFWDTRMEPIEQAARAE